VLQEYQLEIHHVPEKQNIVADTLTRYPRTDDDRQEKRISINKMETYNYSLELKAMILEIGKWQDSDPLIKKKHNKTSTHITKNDVVIFTKNKITDNWRVVVPQQIASRLTQETHEIMGHPSRYKAYHTLRETYIFKNMRS